MLSCLSYGQVKYRYVWYLCCWSKAWSQNMNRSSSAVTLFALTRHYFLVKLLRCTGSDALPCLLLVNQRRRTPEPAVLSSSDLPLMTLLCSYFCCGILWHQASFPAATVAVNLSEFIQTQKLKVSQRLFSEDGLVLNFTVTLQRQEEAVFLLRATEGGLTMKNWSRPTAALKQMLSSKD